MKDGLLLIYLVCQYVTVSKDFWISIYQKHSFISFLLTFVLLSKFIIIMTNNFICLFTLFKY